LAGERERYCTGHSPIVHVPAPGVVWLLTSQASQHRRGLPRLVLGPAWPDYLSYGIAPGVAKMGTQVGAMWPSAYDRIALATKQLAMPSTP